MINIKNIAEGLINDTFTNENLQSTYGGKLELTHAEKLFAPKDLLLNEYFVQAMLFQAGYNVAPLPLELYF